MGVTIDFLVVAFVLFLVVRAISKARGPAPVVEVTTRDCPQCFESIPKKATRCRSCTSEVGAAVAS